MAGAGQARREAVILYGPKWDFAVRFRSAVAPRLRPCGAPNRLGRSRRVSHFRKGSGPIHTPRWRSGGEGEAMDQPSGDGVNTYRIARAIRSAGFKVAISGQGADVAFLGYWQRRRFPALYRLAHLPFGWFNRSLTKATQPLASLHDTAQEKLFQTIGASHGPVAAAYLA